MHNNVEYEVIRAKIGRATPYNVLNADTHWNPEDTAQSGSFNIYTKNGFIYTSFSSKTGYNSQKPRINDNTVDWRMTVNANINTGDKLFTYGKSVTLIDGHKYIPFFNNVCRNLNIATVVGVVDNSEALYSVTPTWRSQSAQEAGATATGQFMNCGGMFTYDSTTCPNPVFVHHGYAIGDISYTGDTHMQSNSRLMLIDVTATYGAGNEPDDWKQVMDDYQLNTQFYPYDPVPGEV